MAGNDLPSIESEHLSMEDGLPDVESNCLNLEDGLSVVEIGFQTQEVAF